MELSILDLIVFFVFMVGTLLFGCSFFSKNRDSSEYTSAKGKLPAWAVGMSIFATYVSSISFLALPGNAYMGNWNPFVFSLSIPFASLIAAKYFVPFYRNINSISAYSYLEERFGYWARIYASCCYLLTQVARIGSVLYLMALPLHTMLGWSVPVIILISGLCVVLYSMLGGITAVIWTDAIQGIVLIAGAVACVLILVCSMPEGPSQLFLIAWENHKFSLGSFGPELHTTTFWVTLIYGLFINLQNYGIDQNYVQRYKTAKDDKSARSAALFGGLLYVPVSMFFFFIGTALFAYYTASPALLPESISNDAVFPYFIVHGLPSGITGLLIAAICAAGMSTVSTSINSSATIILTDFFQHKREMTDKQNMYVLYAASLILGVLGIVLGVAMMSVQSALEAWWSLAGIFSGGMLGLFLLGYMVKRVKSIHAMIGVVCGVILIAWMSSSNNMLFHNYLTIVFGTILIFLVGFLLSLFIGKQHSKSISSMKHFLIALAFVALGGLCSCNQSQSELTKEPVDYVNNRIGNISHLLVPTFPTCHQPNSMIRMNPGHHEFVTDRMEGLPLNVPSHRQGSVLYFMPYCGDEAGLKSHMAYRYDQEKTSPYKYSVLFDDYGAFVEFAPGKRAAIFSCTFEEEGDRYLQLRATGNGEIKGEGNTLYGYDTYVNNHTKHYFYAEFDQIPVAFSESGNGTVVHYAKFDKNVKKVKMRYGVSYISVEQAKKNLEKEIKDFDLEALSLVARNEWNKVLGKIDVTGGSEDQKTTFYTSLYRSHERMINISEDGKYYSGFDGQVHEDEGIDFWTDDWVWDTYHALHPLQIILNPADEAEKLNAYIRMYEQSGWMPTFPCVFGDAHCMNGNHAAVVFADALSKGIPFDVEKAFEGMHHTVMTETMIPWIKGPKTVLDDFYHENGWFPALHPGEKETVPQVGPFEMRQAVAVTQAASYDDWAIAQLAKHLNKKDEYNFHINRAFNYRHLFNKETGFFHPKDKDGKFIEPFDYIFSGGIGSRAYYDENNAWTYIWDVHHNIGDLIDLFGSKQAFIDKLDQLFVEGMKRSKWQYYAVQPDATGNVGQYVMGNEPSFHIPYLYNYVGEPWKAQKRIRMLMESWFRNDLMGICGDEDGGGMSAFYVFSAMGFYPVTAGMPYYVIGSPLFNETSIHLDNGKTFIVIAKNNSDDNKYIQSAELNGQPYNKTYFSHEDILNGGTLTLVMGNRPNKQWGVGEGAIPPSEGTEIKRMK